MHDPPSASALLDELAAFAEAVTQHVNVRAIDWSWRASGDEWSLTEVMCHLRDVEREVHQVRFARLLEEQNAFLSGENPDVWVEMRQYRLEDGPSSLAEFTEARRETLLLLEGIEDEAAWERAGRHAFFGITTLLELVNLAVRHDRAHWTQILALTASGANHKN